MTFASFFHAESWEIVTRLINARNGWCTMCMRACVRMCSLNKFVLSLKAMDRGFRRPSTTNGCYMRSRGPPHKRTCYYEVILYHVATDISTCGRHLESIFPIHRVQWCCRDVIDPSRGSHPARGQNGT